MKKTKKIKIKRSTPLPRILELAPPCSCTACAHGCTMGSGLLADGDLKPLAKFLGLTEEKLKSDWLEEIEQFNKKMYRPKILRDVKPYGRCIFHNKEKGCTVHEAKPLMCRISMGCREYGPDLITWFVLNHVINPNDPEAIRQYKAYIDAGGNVIAGGKIENLVQNKDTLKKILSFRMLK